MSDDFQLIPEDNQPNNAWMISFADLLSLLLTFFVLLFSMSTIEINQWQKLIESLSQRLNPSREINVIAPAEERSINKIEVKIATDLDYLHTILTEKLLASGALNQDVTLRRLDDRVVISLASDALFRSGSADLSPKADAIMKGVGDITRSLANAIEVNGHTDPSPVSGRNYTSNWELSLARATTVADQVRAAGYMDDIPIFGYSDSRYSEITASNLTQNERYNLARRVDIVVREYLPR
ncbi:MAG: chemotaxis protein MotB [Rickettsiales bacterium]|nr:chemotaxis protein MotB [Rickettsiales bacterium]|tara:strand:+ start:277 stop:993 length:717 start_codon:yes stop_codon:yes gene_type:complete